MTQIARTMDGKLENVRNFREKSSKNSAGFSMAILSAGTKFCAMRGYKLLKIWNKRDFFKNFLFEEILKLHSSI